MSNANTRPRQRAATSNPAAHTARKAVHPRNDSRSRGFCRTDGSNAKAAKATMKADGSTSARSGSSRSNVRTLKGLSKTAPDDGARFAARETVAMLKAGDPLPREAKHPPAAHQEFKRNGLCSALP